MVISIRYCCLKRRKIGSTESDSDMKKKNASTFTNILTASLWVWITIIVILNLAIVLLIKKEMQTLATGGIQVVTQPGPGSSTLTRPDETH